MFKIIPTFVHGMLDYASVLTLLIVPRMFRWNGRVTRLMSAAALMTFGYSLITRYELGVFKQLPMRIHLILDGFSGLLLIFSPRLLGSRNRFINSILVGFGIFEVTASLISDPDDSETSHEALNGANLQNTLENAR